MSKNNFQEEEQEIEVDNVSRKEKKKKTKEERSKDRRAVFFVLFFVVFVTFVFWLKAVLVDKKGSPENTDDFMVEDGEKNIRKETEGFYIKYKI